MSRGTACCSDHTPAAVSGRPREGESRSTGELVLFKSNLQLLAIMLQAIEGNYTVHQLEVKVHFVVRELERASQMSTIRIVSRSQTAFTRKGSGTMPMRGLCRTPRNWGVDNCIPHHASPRNRPPTTTGVA